MKAFILGLILILSAPASLAVEDADDYPTCGPPTLTQSFSWELSSKSLHNVPRWNFKLLSHDFSEPYVEEYDCIAIGQDGPRRHQDYFEFDRGEDQELVCIIDLPARLDPNQFVLAEFELIQVIPKNRVGVFNMQMATSNSGGLHIDPHDFGVKVDGSVDKLGFAMDLWGRDGYQTARRPLIITRDLLHSEDLTNKVRIGTKVKVTAYLE